MLSLLRQGLLRIEAQEEHGIARLPINLDQSASKGRPGLFP